MIAEMIEPRQRKKDPYKRLAEINRAITTSLDFDRVLNLIVENAAQLVDASKCMLLLADREQQMRIRASLGIDKNLAASFAGDIEEDLISSLQTLIVPAAAGPMTSVPIIANQALNGLLVIAREGALTEEEEWQLSALADHNIQQSTRRARCRAARLGSQGRARPHISTRKGNLMDTVEQRVKKIVAEQLGVNEADIKPESTFVDDLGADSLDTVELVMALEEEFECEIPDEEAEKITSVQQAIDYIKAHVKA